MIGNIEFNERMKHYKVPGLSIALIDKGQISETETHGFLKSGSHKNVRDNTIFNACSISKFLTGILVLKITEQGLLQLDENVNMKLTSWKIPDNELTIHKKVTLRNLLSHQSGIIDPEQSFMELKSRNDIPSMRDLLNGDTPFCNQAIEVKYEPESEFNYSDAGYCIIQLLVEDVTMKPFEQVVKELIFEPLMMENSTFPYKLLEKIEEFSCGHNKSGEIVEGEFPIYPYPAASGLWTTPSDLSKLVLELLDALRGESKLGISASKAKEMISPQGRSWIGLGVFLGTLNNEFEISSLGWGVGFQCMMIVLPYLEKGAVIMTNAELGVHQLEGIIGEFYRSLKI